MKILKNICITVAICGFILALGTAGTSDFEMETGKILMTNAQFYLRMLVSFVMLSGGILGTRVCSVIIEYKRHYRVTQREYRIHKNIV